MGLILDPAVGTVSRVRLSMHHSNHNVSDYMIYVIISCFLLASLAFPIIVVHTLYGYANPNAQRSISAI